LLFAEKERFYQVLFSVKVKQVKEMGRKDVQADMVPGDDSAAHSEPFRQRAPELALLQHQLFRCLRGGGTVFWLMGWNH
jgi:hypothetical protein